MLLVFSTFDQRFVFGLRSWCTGEVLGRAPLWGFAARDLSATFRQNQERDPRSKDHEIGVYYISLSHIKEKYRRKGFERHHISVSKLPNQFLSGPQWWLSAVWLLHWVRGLGCDLPLKASRISRICCRKVTGVKHFNWWRRQEAERCPVQVETRNVAFPTYAFFA